MTDGLIDGKVYPYPHCNAEVLHAPGECVYCDGFPSRQQARLSSGGAFTPNEANGWSGNVAVKEGQVHSHMGVTWVVGGNRGNEPTASSSSERPFTARLRRLARRLGV
jgi:hypothetical protein